MYEITLTIQNRATQKSTVLKYHPNDFFVSFRGEEAQIFLNFQLDSSLIFQQTQLESGSENQVFLDFRTRALSNIQIRMYIDRLANH